MNNCCLFIMFSLKFNARLFYSSNFMPPPSQTGRQKHCFPFIHLSLTKLVSIFWKGMNRFGCKRSNESWVEQLFWFCVIPCRRKLPVFKCTLNFSNRIVLSSCLNINCDSKVKLHCELLLIPIIGSELLFDFANFNFIYFETSSSQSS